MVKLKLSRTHTERQTLLELLPGHTDWTRSLWETFLPRWVEFPCGSRSALRFSPRFMEAWDGERGKKARRALPPSHVRVVIAPWHTFPFRQNAAAQAEQRGETDPLQKTGCHRVFGSSWREGVIPCQARAVFRPLDGSGSLGLSRQLGDFFLLWETLTAPPPRRYLQQSELVEREDTPLAALTSARGRTDAPRSAQVEAGRAVCSLFFQKKIIVHTVKW